MRICHFSDWHGAINKLPAADLYICTGDMLPNFPMLEFADGLHGQRRKQWRANTRLLDAAPPQPDGWVVGRKFQPAIEANYQLRWIKEVLGSYRDLFPPDCHDAPCLVVRGNHDFVENLSEAFGGDVWEVNSDPTRTHEVLGMKVGGCRGINYIVGEWSDELMDQGQVGAQGTPVNGPAGNWDDVIPKIPLDIEIMITHAPPYGMLDFEGEHYGSKALNHYINERMYVWGKLKGHFFGHVHRAHGSKNEANILFSNCATTHAVYDI